VAKRIKIKQDYYFGKIEMGKYFLGTGQFLFDVSDHLERLPDDVQLAFKVWPHWVKMGKDQRFMEHTAEPGECLSVEFEPEPWKKIMEQGRDLVEVIPTPLLVSCLDDDDTYCMPLRHRKLEAPFWAFVLEEYIGLAHSIFGDFECSFWSKPGFHVVSVQADGQRVGTIAQFGGVPKRMEQMGLGHFFGGSIIKSGIDMKQLAKDMEDGLREQGFEGITVEAGHRADD
jgi:hypothetical protein